jgi:hypothetical protein
VYSVSDVGGLAVAFNRADEETVARALRRLDDRLFLDPEVEPHGPYGPYVYMTVKYHLGSGRPPSLVLEWRDSSGPKPLSLAVVEQVKRQEGAMATAFREVMAANERKRQQSIQATGDGAYDIARSGGKSAAGLRSVNLPRSQSLRMARDKRRARGERI